MSLGKTVTDFIFGRERASRRREWNARVCRYPAHLTKPGVSLEMRPGSFVDRIARECGRRYLGMRRRSGLCLPLGPGIPANEFCIYRKAGASEEPTFPNDLMGNGIPRAFFDYFPSYASVPSKLLRVPKGFFHGSDHALLSDAFEVVDWEPPHWYYKQGKHAITFRASLGEPQRIQGSALVLSAPAAGGNIWHFLFDLVPKLKLIEEAGLSLDAFSAILINSREARFIREGLAILEMDHLPIVETDGQGLFQADELFYVSLGYVKAPDRWAIEYLRERFLPAKTKTSDDIVFISRSGAKRRRVMGEETLLAHLKPLPIRVLQFENLSLTEQVQEMASARAVIAPHGAALTNLAWCHPHTAVIELFPSDYIHVCYWQVSHVADLTYAFSVGDDPTGTALGYRHVNDTGRQSSDIHLRDAEQLAEKIKSFMTQYIGECRANQ